MYIDLQTIGSIVLTIGGIQLFVLLCMAWPSK